MLTSLTRVRTNLSLLVGILFAKMVSKINSTLPILGTGRAGAPSSFKSFPVSVSDSILC